MARQRDLSNALAIIFDDQPTYDPDHYVVSAVGEVRRSLSASDEHEVRPLWEDATLPKWLGSGRLLGPYERVLLADLVSAREGLVVFRGGTGSGKSSLLYRIKTFIDDRFKRDPDRRSICSSCLALSDLQDLPPQLTEERLTSSERDAQLEALFFELARRIDVATDDLLKGTAVWPNALILEALERIGAAKSGSGWQVVAREVRDVVKKDSNTPWSSAAFKQCKPYLRNTDICLASLLPLLGLSGRLSARTRQESNSESGEPDRLILVLDNLDHIPNYLQHDLAGFLARALDTPSWKGSSLSIVLSVRLSSSADPIAAVSHYVWRTHDAPDPAQIVYLRVAHALLDAAAGWEGGEPDSGRVQGMRDCELRLVALWLRLSDPESRMYSVLSALAGTNIRNALLHARAWCLSAALDYVDLPAAELQRFRKNFPRSIAEPMMQEIGASAGRAIGSVLQMAWKGEDATGVAPNAQELGDRMCDIVFDVLRDARILGGEGDGTRCAVGRGAQKALDEYATGAGSRANSWTKLASELDNAIPRDDRRRGIAETAFAIASTKVAEIVARRARATNLAVGAAAHYVGTWVAETGSAICKSRSSERRFVSVEQAKTRKELEKVVRALQRPSRFNSNRLLLEEELEEQDIDCRAANLLARSDGTLSGAPLRILYRLAEARKAPLKVEELIFDLESEGYALADYRRALDDFIGVARRLIYSKVNDHDRGVDRLLSEPNALLHLSWAGRLYYDQLVETPAYVQWALTRSDARQVRVVDRLTTTIVRLNDLAAIEFGQFKERWSAAAEHWREEMHEKALRRRSAVTDLIVRSLGEFLTDIRRHIGKLDRHLRHIPRAAGDGAEANALGSDVNVAASLAERWWDDAAEWVRRYDAIFGKPFDPWTERLTFAEQELNRVRAIQAAVARG